MKLSEYGSQLKYRQYTMRHAVCFVTQFTTLNMNLYIVGKISNHVGKSSKFSRTCERKRLLFVSDSRSPVATARACRGREGATRTYGAAVLAGYSLI